MSKKRKPKKKGVPDRERSQKQIREGEQFYVPKKGKQKDFKG